MEFGVFLSYGQFLESRQEAKPLYERMLELGIQADKEGASYIWVPEHHLIYMLQSPSALIPAVQLAQHVKTKVGTAVVVLPYRGAIQVAGEVAQADNAMGGRLQLGVARGAYGYEFEKLHIPFETSLPRFIETLDAMRLLLENSESESSYHGEYVNFDDVYIWPRPVQQPIPIWLGAQSANAIEDAARRGYNVLTSLFLWDDNHLANLVAAFRRGQEQGGHRDTQIGVTRYAYLAESQADAEDRIDELFDHWRIHQQLHDFSHTSNPRGVIKPRSQANEPDRDEVKRNLLIGTETHLIEKIERYRDMGISVLNLSVNYAPRHERVVNSLSGLGELIRKYSTPDS